MSRTDHARPRRVYGHRVSLRSVSLFFGQRGWQAVCSCGQVSHIWQQHGDAERAKAAHLSDSSAVTA